MLRMRTAQGVMDTIKAEDPDTAITMRYIRRLINSGKIPVVNVGTKKLIDVDAVLEYFATGDPVQQQQPAAVGGIRRVPV